jgi:large subunit ribosomal protein L24
VSSLLTKKQRHVLKRAGFASGRKLGPSITIKKGDTVIVRTGADAGRQGQVIQVLRAENRLLVENIRVVTRHQRRRPGVLQSETVEKPSPIHRSNVMLVCPDCQKPTRIGHATLPGGERVRRCLHCNATLDKE